MKTKFKNRYFLFAQLLFVVIIFNLYSCTSKKKEPIKIGIATWPGFAPGFIGKEKGFFGDLNVDFYIIDDFGARQASFVSGKTQATIGTIDSYAFDQGNGVDGKLILILDQSNGADGIVVKPEINSFRDLKGKKVAFTRGSPSQFFLISLLAENKFTMDSINPIQVDDPGKAGEAFVAGSVDAAVTWEPNITQIKSSGKGKILETTKSKPGFIVDALEVNNEVFNGRKEDLKKFVDGWLKSVDYIKSHQTESYQIMSKALKIPVKEFPTMASGLLYADRTTNNEWLVSNNSAKAKKVFENALNVWESQRLIKRRVKDSALITGEFIK